MKKGKIYTGTSGWQYKHWKGTFYPEAVKTKEEFNYYLSQDASISRTAILSSIFDQMKFVYENL